jgi:hypothetical protein
MSLSARGLDFIKKHERFRAQPYADITDAPRLVTDTSSSPTKILASKSLRNRQMIFSGKM